jgi:hypothetical protein
VQISSAPVFQAREMPDIYYHHQILQQRSKISTSLPEMNSHLQALKIAELQTKKNDDWKKIYEHVDLDIINNKKDGK